MSCKRNMVSKMNSSKVPASVASWYKKLYLQKKGSTKSKFPHKSLEATKTWSSLNESEKKYFYTKYQECMLKYNEKFISCLQNAKPFLKKQTRHRNNNDPSASVEEQQHCNTSQEDASLLLSDPMSPSTKNYHNLSESVEEQEYCYNSQEDENNMMLPQPTPPSLKNDHNISKSMEQQGLCYNSQEDTRPLLSEPTPPSYIINDDNLSQLVEEPGDGDKSREHGRLILSEPTPPSIKTGKEMFEMIQHMGEKSDSAWLSLSQVERRRYNGAVLSIKKDFIQKYVNYLENLSPRDLFDYYNKTII